MPPAGDAWAAAGLLALVLALFQDIVFRGRVLYERDIHIVWHGLAESFVRCLASGSWPLWDPFLSFGRPFLANPATQVLYPWTWLNLLAPPALTYTFYVVSHVWLSGIGLYLLARRLEVSRAAAFVAAAVWMGSGPLLSTVNAWNHLAGAAWMPWVVLAADGALRSPGLGRSLLWGAAMAAQAFAGSPDVCIITGLVMSLYALSVFRRRGRPSARALVGSVTVAAGFALGLAAALWIPALESARNSGRWDMAEGMRTVWSVHPVALLQVVLPLLPADLPLSASARTTLFDVPVPFLSSLYVGLPAVALAAASFAGPRPPWVLGFVTVVASLLALGRHTWAYAVAAQVLPPLKVLRYPSKAMIAAAFCGALLCAIGFEVWRGRETARLRSWRLGVALPAVIGSGVAWCALYLALRPERWGQGLLAAPPGVALENALAPSVRELAVAGILSTAVAVLALARTAQPGRGQAGLAVAAVAIAGLFWAHRNLNPTAPPDFYRRRPAILDVLKQDRAGRLYVFDYQGRVTGRVYRSPIKADVFAAASPLLAARGLQEYLFPSIGSRWGLYGSYETDLYSLYSPQLKSLTLILRAAEETPLHDRLLKIGAVDHVVALHAEGLESLERIATMRTAFAAPIQVFRIPGAWPRSYVVSGTRIADGLQAYRVLADPTFDPAREVVLPSGAASPAAAGPIGTSRILELRHDRVRVEAELRQPGHLVLADTFDPGWRATVDGGRTDIVRANGAFRAVRLGPGRHIVDMVYRPASVVAGGVISAASLLVGGALGAARALGSSR